MKLRSRNIVVTGATQGLGRTILESFLREGANVIFCARNAEDVAEALESLQPQLANGQSLEGISADVSRDKDMEALFQAAEALGPLQAVVNNAGIYGPIGPIEDIDPGEWQRTFDINLFGIVRTARHAIPKMKRQGYGKLIQISGGGASPIPNFSAYTVSKMAVTRLTEALAEELREHRIDVNAIAPGPLYTRLTEEVLQVGPERAGQSFYEKNLAWSRGAAVSPDLAAEVAVYLASAASDGITGKLIAAQWDPWSDFQKHLVELESDIYTFRRIVPKDRGMDWGN